MRLRLVPGPITAILACSRIQALSSRLTPLVPARDPLNLGPESSSAELPGRAGPGRLTIGPSVVHNG